MSIKEILCILENVASKGHTLREVFDNYIDLTLYTILGDKTSFIQCLEKFPDCLRIMVIHSLKTLRELTVSTKRDIIGEIYETLSLNYKGFGQFFTPHNLSEMIAKMLSGIDPQSSPNVLDPACGSGRLLLYYHNICPTGVYVGQDIDLLCVKMTVLNFYFFQVQGYVIWGNSLVLECKAVYYSSPGKIILLNETELEQFSESYFISLNNSLEVEI